MSRRLLSDKNDEYELSEEAAQVSVTLVGDDAGGPVPVLGGSAVPLTSARLQRVVRLLEATVVLLDGVADRAALVADGIQPSRATSDELATRGLAMLRSLGCDEFAQVAELLGDLRWLDCPLPASILALRISKYLCDCEDSVALRVLLDASDDLSQTDKDNARSEPLFSAPRGEEPGAVQPPALTHSASFAMDAGIPDEGNTMACLALCDARTLRNLKSVSAAWRRRARQMLGEATSAWRKHPVWCTSERGLALVAELAHPDADDRYEALNALRDMSDEVAGFGAVELPAYAAAVVAKLEDSDVDVREAAVETLGKLEPAALAQHAATIVAKLEHSNEDVRMAAVDTLGELEPAALAQHAAAVVAKLEDSKWGVRRAAAATLGKLEPAALAQHAAAVVAKLEDSKWGVRRAAAATLGKLEPAALAQHSSAIVQLEATEAEQRVLIAATPAMCKLQPESAEQRVLAVVAKLEDSDWRVRQAAVETLGQLEPAALAQHAAAVVAKLEDSKWGVRRAAAATLGQLEPAALAQHAAAIVAKLEDSDEEVRRAAVETLGQLEPEALAQHAAAIKERLNDDDLDVRKAAEAVVAKLGS